MKVTQPDGGDSKPDRLGRRVNLALLCVFLCFAILWGLLLGYRFTQTIGEGERRADNLALILSEHLRRSVEAVDSVLLQLALHSQRSGGPKAAGETWTPLLEAARAGISGISLLGITDETGVITVSTLPEVLGQSRRDQYMFQQLARTRTAVSLPARRSGLGPPTAP